MPPSSRHPVNRPRIPLLRRLATDATGQQTFFGQVLRALTAAAVVINPVLAVLTGICALSLARTRARGWWLAAAGLAAGAVALILGAWGGYWLMWADLLGAVGSLRATREVSVLAQAAEAWPAWLTGQLLLAVPGALCLTGAILAYRHRYDATWRREARGASKRAIARAAAAIERTDLDVDAAPAGAVDVLRIPVGVDEHTGTAFTLTGSALRLHLAVGGPTGMGKSTTMQRFIHELVSAPLADPISVCLIDMKGDGGMRQFFTELARAHGRRLHLVTVDPATSATWNPLRHGDPSHIRSRVINTEETSSVGGFSEPHYRVLGERLVLVCAKALVDLAARGAPAPGDGPRRAWLRQMSDLVALMHLPTLAKQVDQLSPAVARDVRKFLEEVSRNDKIEADVYGMYARFALWCEGPAGQIIAESPGALDLLQAIDGGDLILFSMDAAIDKATARTLGNLALADYTYCLAALADRGFAAAGRLALCAVDEFSALGGSQLGDLYARARGSGGSVALASQALMEDLHAVDGDGAFAAQVLKNAGTIVLHQQRGEDPDKWANAIGTQRGWTETLQITDDVSVLGTQSGASGVGSLRETDSFRVHPNTLRELRQGQAVVLTHHPTRAVATVRISPPPKLEAAAPEPNPWTAAASPATSPEPPLLDPVPTPAAGTGTDDDAPPLEPQD